MDQSDGSPPHAHPLYPQAPVCGSCLATYNLGEFEVRGGHEIFCRLCGNGGDLFLCDACPRGLCVDCVGRTLGPSYAAREGSDAEWRCFECDEKKLAEAAAEAVARHLRGDGQVAPGPAAAREAAEDGVGAPGRARGRGAPAEARPGGEAPRGRARRQEKEWRVLISDVSNGIERVPIRVVGATHGPLPEPFSYVRENIPHGDFQPSDDPAFRACCDCADGCADPTRCACVRRTGDRRAYDDDGCVDWANEFPAIYECNASCACRDGPGGCKNVVGAGLTLPLEVFRCDARERGWGVRCTRTIPAGSFVAVYCGELLTDEEADARGRTRGDEYLFNMDCYQIDAARPQTSKSDDLFELHGPPEQSSASSAATPPEPSPPPSRRRTRRPPGRPRRRRRRSGPRRCRRRPCARRRGRRGPTASTRPCASTLVVRSVGALRNRPEPNMAKQMVFVDSQDVRTPKIAFFALWDIPPKTELTYDYGYEVNQVHGRSLACKCGAEQCRGRLY
ncbi:histone-lysine N-methyltransferase [Aureococcus anophagefferens]|nr:histone-lysine N-methyltransferase [Aureococcus anophagefferens]